MHRRQLLAIGVAAGVASAPASSRARDGDQPDLVGSWFGTITATEPPLGRFNNLISFYDGGVTTETRRYLVQAPPPFGNLLETTGHSAWERVGKNTFEVPDTGTFPVIPITV